MICDILILMKNEKKQKYSIGYKKGGRYDDETRMYY